MKTLFEYFIEKWRLSFSILGVIIMMGASGATSLKKESYPSINLGSVIITTIYPGASSQETEENVTDIIEKELRSVTGLKDVTSFSQPGMSRIVIRIDIDKEDTEEVLDDIKEAVDRAGPLPQNLPFPPVVTEIKSDEIAVMRIALWSEKGYSDVERFHVADTLEDYLELLPGVARVDLEGYQKPEFQILLNQNKMLQQDVGVSEILNAVSTSVVDTPAGEIKWDGKKKLVRVTGKVTEAWQLENIIIRANFMGHALRVRDIARVLDGSEQAEFAVSFNRHPATTLSIIKKTNADIIDTGNTITEEIEKFKSRLPEGLHVEIYDSESERVQNKLSIVTGNAIAGIFLVLGALLIFFPGLPGVMTAISMPVSVLMVLGLMPSIGARINNITMTAIIISLGLLVDNAIVVGENYVKLRHEGYPPLDASKKAVSQFWIPILATALTTIMSFVPMLVTTGIMGQFISYIPLIVTIAIAASLVEAFILLPARLRFTMKERVGETGEIHSYEEKGWFARIQKTFEKSVRFSLKHRYITAMMFPVLIIISIMLSVYGNYFELFPQTDVEIYYAKFEAKPGTSLERTHEYAMELEKKMLDAIGQEKVKYSVTTIGTTQDVPMDIMARFGEHTGRVRIVFPLEVARVQNNKDILSKLRTIKMDNKFNTLWFESKAMGPPVGKALELNFSGIEVDQIKAAIHEAENMLRKYPGVLDVTDDDVLGMPEIHFDVNQKDLRSGGFTISGLGRALRTAMQGETASRVSVRGEQIKVLVKYDDPFRKSAANIMRTTLTGPTGNQIPVGNLTRIVEKTGSAVRKHYQYRRAITLTADVDNNQMTSIQLNNIVINKVFPEIKAKYPSVNISFLGEAESRQEAFQSLLRAMVFAVAFIALILVFIFNSFLKPFIILGTIPLALIGVNIAFFIHQVPLSFMSVIGGIGLMGVVINATIILISYVDDLKKDSDLEGLELLAYAAASRLKPILVTSLTTIGGFLPTAYGLGGYDPMLAPLTLAMAWGMITATFLGLIATPVALAILDDAIALSHRIIGRFT